MPIVPRPLAPGTLVPRADPVGGCGTTYSEPDPATGTPSTSTSVTYPPDGRLASCRTNTHPELVPRGLDQLFSRSGSDPNLLGRQIGGAGS